MGPTDAMLKYLPTQPEPTDSRYRCFNTGGVEVEVGEFLYGLVRMVKPARVLETGTHKGISASYIGLALKENGRGKLTTVDITPQNVEDAGHLFAALGLMAQIEQVAGDASEFVWGCPDPIDLLFLDTEPPTRFAELLRFYASVRDGGFILVHDLHHHLSQEDNLELGFGWPYGRIPDELKRLIDDGRLRSVHFRTPRGMTLFYKPSAKDYGESLLTSQSSAPLSNGESSTE